MILNLQGIFYSFLIPSVLIPDPHLFLNFKQPSLIHLYK